MTGTTEKIQWGADLVFKVGGKMYAAMALEDEHAGRLSFKSTPEGFAELIEREGIEPAAYAARYHWVTVLPPHVVRDDEMRALLRAAYDIVRSCLPKKTQAQLATQDGMKILKTKAVKPKTARSKARRKRK